MGGAIWVKIDGEPFFSPRNFVIRAIVVTDQATGVAEEGILIPSDYVLKQNYPNPFNPGDENRVSASASESYRH